ncbi:hypothetical protein P7K49_006484, partial [Saguinus oedipus]
KRKNFPRMKSPQELSELWSSNVLSFVDNSASVSKPQDQEQTKHPEENLYQQAQDSDHRQVAPDDGRTGVQHAETLEYCMPAIPFPHDLGQQEIPVIGKRGER